MENTMNLWVLYDFRNENQICPNYHYDSRNQRVKIRRYTKVKKSEIRPIEKYIQIYI